MILYILYLILIHYCFTISLSETFFWNNLSTSIHELLNIFDAKQFRAHLVSVFTLPIFVILLLYMTETAGNVSDFGVDKSKHVAPCLLENWKSFLMFLKALLCFWTDSCLARASLPIFDNKISLWHNLNFASNLVLPQAMKFLHSKSVCLVLLKYVWFFSNMAVKNMLFNNKNPPWLNDDVRLLIKNKNAPFQNYLINQKTNANYNNLQ